MEGKSLNRTMMRPCVLLALAVSALTMGCHGRGNTELLESKLRLQGEQLGESNRQKQRLGKQLAAVERERDLLASRLSAESGVLPEIAKASGAVENIEIQHLLSGQTVDGESQNAIKLVVQPVDSDDEVIRAVGGFEVTARRAPVDGGQEIELVGHQESALGKWKFTSKQTDEMWHSGFGRGYHLRLPIQATVVDVPLEFVVRFKSLDGREFETSAVISPIE